MIQLIFNKRPIRNDRLISNSYTVVRIQEGRPGVPERGRTENRRAWKQEGRGSGPDERKESRKRCVQRQAKASPNESELSERTGEDSAENRVRKGKTETDLPPQS